MLSEEKNIEIDPEQAFFLSNKKASDFYIRGFLIFSAIYTLRKSED